MITNSEESTYHPPEEGDIYDAVIEYRKQSKLCILCGTKKENLMSYYCVFHANENLLL